MLITQSHNQNLGIIMQKIILQPSNASLVVLDSKWKTYDKQTIVYMWPYEKFNVNNEPELVCYMERQDFVSVKTSCIKQIFSLSLSLSLSFSLSSLSSNPALNIMKKTTETNKQTPNTEIPACPQFQVACAITRSVPTLLTTKRTTRNCQAGRTSANTAEVVLKLH